MVWFRIQHLLKQIQIILINSILFDFILNHWIWILTMVQNIFGFELNSSIWLKGVVEMSSSGIKMKSNKIE